MKGTGSSKSPPSKGPSPGPRAGGASSARGPGDRPDPPPLVSRLLRLPLFWKLAVVQLLLLGVVGIGVAGIQSSQDADTGPVLWILGVVGVLAAAAISAWLTRVALSPLEAIEETAERVRAGDYDARAPSSPIADRRLRRVGSILNEMLDSLDRARRRQRELSLQVLRSQERERSRMSGSLYDQTAQTLAGVLVRLKVLSRQDPDLTDPESLTLVTDQIREALEEVRTVARRRRPPELNDLGVRSALEALGRELEEEYDLSVRLEGDLPESRMTEDARLALFRVVQEALDNVALHARAHEARVTFRSYPGEIRVEVRDEGIGFDPDELGADGVPQLAVVTMIERAGYAEGQITVEASPGLGTRVNLAFPLDGRPLPQEDPVGAVLVGEGAAALHTADSHPTLGGPHVQ